MQGILALGPALALLAAPSLGGETPRVMPLLDFADDASVDAWRPVHDRVMGGVSSGVVRRGRHGVRFEGRVSLENNGGFASFRAAVRMPDLSEQDGLRLRVVGDGEVYKLSLRTDGAWDGVSWQAPFATRAGEETVVDLAFSDLAPTWRGRLVLDAPPLDAASIRQVGILIADEQEGPFALELASIDAWSADGEPAPGSRAAERSRTRELAHRIDAGAEGEELLSTLRWTERLVVVAAPSDLDAFASRQVGHLLSQADALADRELRIVRLLGDRAGRLAGRTLSPAVVRSLRDALELPTRERAVALVGKDGDVHARWSSLVDPAEVLRLVDAMPMRRREAEERGRPD